MKNDDKYIHVYIAITNTTIDTIYLMEMFVLLPKLHKTETVITPVAAFSLSQIFC